ncbi:MAG: lysophospholipid acyltransferase family protein [Candidatus Krumholzibacteriia bacterium]
MPPRSGDFSAATEFRVKRRLRLGGYLGAGLIRAWGSTWRIEFHGEHFREDACRHAPVHVYSFWHGRMLALSYSFREQGIQLLASEHRDGELMGQVVRSLGYGHVRGSSTRGGARAIRELVARLRAGYHLGLTVDGPVGPPYVFKPGPIEIAKLSGAPLIPITASTPNPWVLSSWDAFQMPRPFARVSVRFGRPIVVPPDADEETIEAKRREAEGALTDLTRMNDESISHPDR